MATNKGYFSKRGLQRGSKLPPMRDAYARQDNRVEYQIFSSEYFSAADVKLYFGDIWVDEVTDIQFQLQEEVMPIYGYNSYTFDTVARGKRIIQGSFAINFTSVGYLQQIMANANAIFYALEEGKKKDLIKPEYYQNMRLDEILKKLGKDSFEQIADEYEKAIWGDEDSDELQLNYADMPYFRQDDLGFDIRIQYGAVSEAVGYVNDKFYMSNKTEPPNVTVDVINGVQLTGMSKQGIGVNSQGAPITEIYSFMARDLNGISFNHLQRMTGNDKQEAQTMETTYRKMQYGVIR
jgi:hypothetical protein